VNDSSNDCYFSRADFTHLKEFNLMNIKLAIILHTESLTDDFFFKKKMFILLPFSSDDSLA